MTYAASNHLAAIVAVARGLLQWGVRFASYTSPGTETSPRSASARGGDSLARHFRQVPELPPRPAATRPQRHETSLSGPLGKGPTLVFETPAHSFVPCGRASEPGRLAGVRDPDPSGGPIGDLAPRVERPAPETPVGPAIDPIPLASNPNGQPITQPHPAPPPSQAPSAGFRSELLPASNAPEVRKVPAQQKAILSRPLS